MVIKVSLVIVGRRSLVDAMNDPWDVKSVRKSGQYLSCMKINGVPLLPPVLSKECRKEMQYYKLLAREVEKRIKLLKPYTLETDSEDSDEMVDAPDMSVSEPVSGEAAIDSKCPTSSPEKSVVESPKLSTVVQPHLIDYCSITSSPKSEDPPVESQLIMDLTLDLIGANRNSLETNIQHTSQTEIPERDCESPKKIKEKEQLTDVEPICSPKKNQAVMDSVKKFVDNILESYPTLNQDGPSSLSSKSFTGSLNDLHTGSLTESQKSSKLIRQRSYTLLEPSPQLLAHLEVQSLNTGIEMTNISMSESLSNLSSPHKKRRSWDLESAKVKWSSMALELNKSVPKPNGINKNLTAKGTTSPAKKTSPNAPRSKSVAQEKPRRCNMVSKTMVKSESVQKVVKIPPSPVRNSTSVTSQRPIVKETTSPKNTLQKKDASPTKPLVSGSEDPATKVKELYEKIQKQQQAQMATLIEKQKREQLLLQQVFEEQNNLLFKQLKTICPKSPIEAKEAWVDKVSDKGLVSLSQLINQKSPDQTITNSPVSSTLTETHNYINHCNDVLKKSRDITGSLKKQCVSKNGTKIQSPRNTDGSSTRTHSPSQRIASRRLNYDSSNSTDRECEPLLTDRTSDTFADLNVTFPSDNSDDAISLQRNGSKQSGSKVSNGQASPPAPLKGLSNSNIDAAIRNMEESLYKSINANKRQMKQEISRVQPTAQEREAATKIVAYAKGFLVRRLLRTERVQATVQTIKDALLCALQLHQDRAGIRGADVDLHRRLIQQITAACYSLHDTFVASTAEERCSMIAADRGRLRAQAARAAHAPRPASHRALDIMTQSHSGSFPVRVKRPPSSPMSRSQYETFSTENLNSTRFVQSPQRQPWR